jgi:DNA-3-methyladenine glycosylase
MAYVTVLAVPAAAADDPAVVAELTDLVNRVYATAEEGLWQPGTTRTTPAEMGALVRAGEIAAVRRDGRLAGAVRVRQLDGGAAEFGMLVAAPQERGTGVGRELVAYAEDWARRRRLVRMQLELLVPRTWSHPVKEFLRAWYSRMGYREVRTDRLDEAYPALVPRLATPCDFLVFRKDLTDYPWLHAPAEDVAETARTLLGWRLTAGGVTVRLTEVEAYSGLGADPASHAHRGITDRNRVMFGPPGRLYVYQIYGMHFCANVVCGPAGVASAVLLRAGQVVDGLAIARVRRPVRREPDLASGPAKLMQVLALGRAANGTSVVDGTGPALLIPPDRETGPVESGPRVGVTSAHDVPWRFWIKGDPTVSSYRRHAPRRRPATGG